MAISIFFPWKASAEGASDAWALIEEDENKFKASFSGDFQNRTDLFLFGTDESADFLTSRELLYGKGQFQFSKKVSVTLSGLFDYTIRFDKHFDVPGGTFEGRMEEAYTDIHLGKLDLRLGQQIVTWGKTDVMSPTDTVNSQDFRHVIDTELGHVKIPNLMLKADYYPSIFHLEAIFIPFFRPSRIDFIGGNWSPLGNRLPVSSLNGVFATTPDARRIMSFLDLNFPDWQKDLEDDLSTDRLNLLGPTTPVDDLQHWEAAGRAGATWGRISGSASYIYGFSDLPTIFINPNLMPLVKLVSDKQTPNILADLSGINHLTPIVISKFERQHQIGADFSANLGPSVVRAEGAYVLYSDLYTKSLEVVKKPMLTYTVSADYQLPNDTVFNLQFLQSYTQDWTKDMLSARAYTFLVSYARTTFIDGKLELYAELLYDVSRWSMDRFRKGEIFGEDFEVSSKISYLLRQNLKLGVGEIIFSGPRNQLLAIAHSRSFSFLDLKYSF